MKLLKKKKGSAIELAIVFMVLVFGMCAVITSIMFSMRSKDRIMTTESNNNFIIDQMGEYFIRAMKRSSSVDFKKDVKNESTDIRGGWVKFIYDAEDSKISPVFGVNVNHNDSNATTTFRLAKWDKVDASGNIKGAPLLIVTVKEKSTAIGGQLEILNWSNQEIKYNAKDLEVSKNTNFVTWLIERIIRIVNNVRNILNWLF